MAYEIGRDESVTEAVRRMAIEQIDLAAAALENPGGDVNAAIKSARQSFKRVRALLALVRCDFGATTYREENRCFRDLARRLGVTRDDAVVAATFEQLVARAPAAIPKRTLQRTRRLLAKSSAQLPHVARAELSGLCAELDSARARVRSWRLPSDGFGSIRGGLRRTYRLGRDRLAEARIERTPAGLHAWRQPVRLLWNEVLALTPVWPRVMAAYGGELHRLSKLLNSNHDLSLLRERLLHLPLTESHSQALVSLLDARTGRLGTRALKLGRRLYAERPSQFVYRIRRYWQAW